MPESNPCLPDIVRGHLDIHLVAHADTDEVFAHLAGDMREHLVSVGKGHAKHRARQDLCHRASQFDWIFFSHADRDLRYFLPPVLGKINPEKCIEIRGFKGGN